MTTPPGGRFNLLRKLTPLAALTVLSLSPPWNAATAAYAEGAADANAFQTGMNVSAVPGNSGAAFIALVKVIFFLIIIIGIFLLIMKVLAKKKWRWNGGRAVFRSYGGLPLGQNKSVQIVEIGKSLYVLGVGDDVKLIQKIDDPEEIAYITACLAPDPDSGGQRWQSIRSLLTGAKKSEAVPIDDESELSASSFQDVFQSKMKHMTGRKKMIEEMLRNDDSANRKVDP